MEMVWKWNGNGMEIEWKRYGNGMEMEWEWSGMEWLTHRHIGHPTKI